jgi:hypothetical protein
MSELAIILEQQTQQVHAQTLYQFIHDKQALNRVLSELDITLDVTNEMIRYDLMSPIDRDRLISALTMRMRKVENEFLDITFISTILQFAESLQTQLAQQAYDELLKIDSQAVLAQAHSLTHTHLTRLRPKAYEQQVNKYIGLNDNLQPLAVYERGITLHNYYIPVIRVEQANETTELTPLQFDDEERSEDGIPVIDYND